jgi:pimeloyl-ACP methyl ester carboxylesterase
MDLKRGLAYAGLAVAGAAAANVGLRSSAGALEPPLEGRHRTYRWRGMSVDYTEAGDPDDPTVVCLHGVNAAASSGEFREVFADLAADHHVVAPDLPGFGRSDRPPLRYSAALYEDFVADFLGRYAGASPAVLASGLTASYAVRAAGEPGTDVSRLLLVCPTTRGGPSPPRGAIQELIRAPLVGEFLFNLLVSKPSIRYFNADHGYYDLDRAGEEWMEYEWRTAHQPGARFAPAGFISGALNADLDLGAALADREVPTTLLWGREADVTPLSTGRDVAEAADARLVVFDDAKLLPHVEFPAAFLDAVRAAMRDGDGDADGDGGFEFDAPAAHGVTTEREGGA